ncbi:MAG: hypothetical protein LC795_06545 [Acidobacteria bacterium]|nr:hypothetical protein [Acidobacteriota bacterium]
MTGTEARAIRIFSLGRAALSCVLGFLIPLGYAILLSEVDDYFFPNGPPPDFMVWPFGWPRPVWILLMGRQPGESDILGGVIFLAVCNTLLYGALVYGALTMLSLARRRRADFSPPPPPEVNRAATP